MTFAWRLAVSGWKKISGKVETCWNRRTQRQFQQRCGVQTELRFRRSSLVEVTNSLIPKIKRKRSKLYQNTWANVLHALELKAFGFIYLHAMNDQSFGSLSFRNENKKQSKKYYVVLDYDLNSSPSYIPRNAFDFQFPTTFKVKI